jgi:hypothetical protein
MPSGAGTPGFSNRRVHFSFSPLARLLVVTVLPKIGEDTRFLALLFEAPERTLEVLIVMDDDFRQAVCPPFAANLKPTDAARELP